MFIYRFVYFVCPYEGMIYEYGVGGWSCCSDCSAWQWTMYGVYDGGWEGERRGGHRKARGERGIVNVLKREREDCLLIESREARWREKEPLSVIECEQETVPVRNGASWREIKHRERERTAVEESTGWNVDMWTSATTDLVWLCDGVDREWSAVTGSHEAFTQSGFQADQWVADMWVTFCCWVSVTYLYLIVYALIWIISWPLCLHGTLIISCSLHLDST